MENQLIPLVVILNACLALIVLVTKLVLITNALTHVLKMYAALELSVELSITAHFAAVQYHTLVIHLKNAMLRKVSIKKLYFFKYRYEIN